LSSYVEVPWKAVLYDSEGRRFPTPELEK